MVCGTPVTLKRMEHKGACVCSGAMCMVSLWMTHFIFNREHNDPNYCRFHHFLLIPLTEGGAQRYKSCAAFEKIMLAKTTQGNKI